MQPTLDSVELNPGSGGSKIAGDLIGGKFWQVALVGFSSGDGTGSVVGVDTPLPVDIKTSSLTVAGTVAATQSGTWNIASLGAVAGVVHVDDNNASLSIDVGGTVPGLDNTNALRASLYGKNAAAGDTPLAVDASGQLKIGVLPALSAGSNVIGKASMGQDTNVLYDGIAPLAVKSFTIACGASGDNVLMSAVANKRIRVLSLFLAAAKGATAAVGIFWKSSGGTAISGNATHAIPVDKTGMLGPSGFSLPFSPAGHFETLAGEALVVNLDASQAVMGHGKYVEV